MLVSILQNAAAAFPFRIAACQMLDIIGHRWPAAGTWCPSVGGGEQLVADDTAVSSRLVAKLFLGVDCPDLGFEHMVSASTTDGHSVMVISADAQGPAFAYADASDRSIRWVDYRQVRLLPGAMRLANPWTQGGSSGVDILTLPLLTRWMIYNRLPRF
ncbi:hypothetical protein J3459_007754 [Metarhizium acridum]|nr:hypothetical protein J3459_018592 [Metarhizium acridum]KAG8409982.1 hypothetical protein J3458_019054 [Metarhizium acridum]KAG8426840.1 hypothetical protein J3459_007754 [Metarhizium acridum]